MKDKEVKKIKLDNTVIVAIIALLGTFLGYLFDSINKQNQQQREFESTLIINAIETGNSEVSKKNLKFLIDANLISNKTQQIKLTNIIKDSTYKIVRGASTKFSKNNIAYICVDPKASKYHLSQNCQALNRCQSTILEISIKDAESKYQRMLCAWEN